MLDAPTRRRGDGGWGKLHLRLELLGTRCAARAGRSALAAALPWSEENTGLELDWCQARHQIAECSAARPKQGGDGSALGPAILGKMAVPVHAEAWWAQRRQSQCHKGTGLVSAWDGPRL